MAGGQARDSVPRRPCSVRSEIADRAEAIRLLWLLERGRRPSDQGGVKGVQSGVQIQGVGQLLLREAENSCSAGSYEEMVEGFTTQELFAFL